MKPALEYIDALPEPYRSIALELQLIIESQFKDVKLYFKWKLPFYYKDGKMFCFLNFRKNYIDLGIPDGILLNDPNKMLIAGEKRKKLRSLRFYLPEDIDAIQIHFYLNQLDS
jgi:hypothetical protein